MTPEKLHIIRHSLGRWDDGQLPPHCKAEYRDFFATEPGCDHYVLIQELVAEGMMKFTGKTGFGTMEYFHVTEAGRAAALQGVKARRLTRSQRRYREFLAADCGMKFGEWLRGEAARRKRRNAWRQEAIA